MLTLGINTASSFSEIALLEGDQVLANERWESQNDEAEKIMPKIAELLGDKTFQDISEVKVIKGPGSFTGLRIGVAVANAISHLTGAKLSALDTFAYWWTAHPSPEPSTALLIFAGRGGVYVSLKPSELGQLVNLPDLIPHLQSHNITSIFGDLSAAQKSHLSDFSFQPHTPDFPQALSTTHATHTLVKPLYIKPPNITMTT